MTLSGTAAGTTGYPCRPVPRDPSGTSRSVAGYRTLGLPRPCPKSSACACRDCWVGLSHLSDEVFLLQRDPEIRVVSHGPRLFARAFYLGFPEAPLRIVFGKSVLERIRQWVFCQPSIDVVLGMLDGIRQEHPTLLRVHRGRHQQKRDFKDYPQRNVTLPLPIVERVKVDLLHPAYLIPLRVLRHQAREQL